MTSGVRKARTFIIWLIALVAVLGLGLFARNLLSPPLADQHLTTEPACNLLDGCSARLGDQTIALKLISSQNTADAPVSAQSPLRFLVKLEGIEADDVSLQLQGKHMYMGENHYALQPTSSKSLQGQTQGEYDVSTALPVCTTGTMTWQAHVRVYNPNGSYEAVFEFDAL